MSTYECSGFAARPFATHTVRGARPAPPSSLAAPRAAISPATSCRARGPGRRRRTRQLPPTASSLSDDNDATPSVLGSRWSVVTPTCPADTGGGARRDARAVLLAVVGILGGAGTERGTERRQGSRPSHHRCTGRDRWSRRHAARPMGASVRVRAAGGGRGRGQMRGCDHHLGARRAGSARSPRRRLQAPRRSSDARDRRARPGSS